MRILKEGDTGLALAPGEGQVPVVYAYRELTLDSGVQVEDVLVGVREGSDEVLVIPAQSTPRIKAAREASKDETIEARVPRELDDVLTLIADRFGTSTKKFSPSIVRYYLSRASAEPRLARRLTRLARGPLASAPRRKTLKVRCESRLTKNLDRLSHEHLGTTRSDFIRGALAAAKEDVLDGKAKRRMAELKAVAESV